MSRFTYQHLVELVEGDHELIIRLVEEGFIARGEDDVVSVDVDTVLLIRTLWRDLAVDWAGIEIIVRLTGQLAEARRRLGERDDR